MNTEPGDKVRLKTAAHGGERGVVENVLAAKIAVRLDGNGKIVQVAAKDVTNYSLAARKAWQRMPDRRVGRPKGTATTDRVSVTLRIDRELWNRFRQAEEAGLIEDRTAAINAWIADRLATLAD